MEKYFKEDETFNLRLIVIYTSDVQSAEPTLEADCFTLRTEQAFLSHIDGKAAFHEIQGKLRSGIPLADDDLMRLVILPLTVPGTEGKQNMVIRKQGKKLKKLQSLYWKTAWKSLKLRKPPGLRRRNFSTFKMNY